MQPVPGDRLAAYGQTVVEIQRPGEGSITVRSAPEVDESAWPWQNRQAVHILTAWDPGTERPGIDRNRLRQAALESELRLLAIPMWAAVGVDAATGRREEGVAVMGVSEPEVLALGARYGQDAVFAWTPGAWVIVPCGEGQRLVSGWSLCPPWSLGA